ncbi:MAG: epimerase, partial [Pirellulaceae bacterium]
MKSIRDVAALEDLLSEPTDYVIDSLAVATGDTILLGVGGKMGPTLTRMLVRACQAAGDARKIIAVSRFSNALAKQSLADLGVETISGDLLADGFVDDLPDADNVIHMTGMKFGTGTNAA